MPLIYAEDGTFGIVFVKLQCWMDLRRSLCYLRTSCPCAVPLTSIALFRPDLTTGAYFEPHCKTPHWISGAQASDNFPLKPTHPLFLFSFFCFPHTTLKGGRSPYTPTHPKPTQISQHTLKLFRPGLPYCLFRSYLPKILLRNSRMFVSFTK